MRPICHGCRMEMACEQNGLMLFPAESDEAYAGDLYRCRLCGFAVVAGISDESYALNYIPPPHHMLRLKELPA